MAALAASLASAQFAARVDRNTARADSVERRISAASALKSQILQLAASVGDRVRSGDLSAQPTIANGAVAAVSRGIASGSGSHTLEVTALAAAQTLASPAYASKLAPTGSGTLTLRVGTITGTTFAEDPGHAAAKITIASGATLADVAAAINAAGTGVSAYVASGADGARLMLNGQEGAGNGFILEAAETGGDPGLATLAWQPTGDSARYLSSAADAAFKLDGLAMTSAANTVENVVPGLTIKLTGTNPAAPTRISFSNPAQSVATFMQDLTGALNELAGALNKQIDPQTGDLAGDAGARALRNALSQLAGAVVMPGAAEGAPRALADLGLATERDGTFRFDASRLAATLKAAPDGAAAMFTTGLYGVYATLDKLSRTVAAASSPGSLAGSLTSLAAQKARLASEKTDLADRQEKLRQQLSSRFAQVDTRVAASKSTLSFLQAQIAAWNGKGTG